MRSTVRFATVLAAGLTFASAAFAEPAERGYQAQSNVIKHKFLAGDATFGPSMDGARGHKIFGEVAHVGTGCPGTAYLADPAGKVALVERGGCSFVDKVMRAEAAGAVAVVVYNHEAGGDGVTAMGRPGGFVDTIGIPSAFVGRSNGLAMASAELPGKAAVTVQVKDKTRDKLDTRDQ